MWGWGVRLALFLAALWLVSESVVRLVDAWPVEPVTPEDCGGH